MVLENVDGFGQNVVLFFQQSFNGGIKVSRFICFDVETPNFCNDRMSAIGISVVENGALAEEFYSLVNPEAEFDRFNIYLTGITPEAVANAPTFLQLWPKIRPILKSGLLVAHNAQFDMSVLSKCLSAYNIPCAEKTRYACTCTMGKRVEVGMPDHKLNTMCRELGIELDHHNAGSDARACALLLIHYLSKGADVSGFVREYDLRGFRTLRTGAR